MLVERQASFTGLDSGSVDLTAPIPSTPKISAGGAARTALDTEGGDLARTAAALESLDGPRREAASELLAALGRLISDYSGLENSPVGERRGVGYGRFVAGGGSSIGVGGATEGEFVARCRRGDQAAWSALDERFSRYVYAIALQGFRLSEAEAEDVFQEVFARTFEHFGRLRDDEAIRPWIGQLTCRLAIDRLRKSKRLALESDPEPDDAAIPDEDAFARLDEAMEVRDALVRLPEDSRDVLERAGAAAGRARGVGRRGRGTPGGSPGEARVSAGGLSGRFSPGDPSYCWQ